MTQLRSVGYLTPMVWLTQDSCINSSGCRIQDVLCCCLGGGWGWGPLILLWEASKSTLQRSSSPQSLRRKAFRTDLLADSPTTLHRHRGWVWYLFRTNEIRRSTSRNDSMRVRSMRLSIKRRDTMFWGALENRAEGAKGDRKLRSKRRMAVPASIYLQL